jgi:hypothetical protein
MKSITKETFLSANDPKNRDAMLYDMLDHMNGKLDYFKELKDRVIKVEKKISYIKGIGTAITLVLSMLMAWVIKVTGGQ